MKNSEDKQNFDGISCGGFSIIYPSKKQKGTKPFVPNKVETDIKITNSDVPEIITIYKD